MTMSIINAVSLACFCWHHNVCNVNLSPRNEFYELFQSTSGDEPNIEDELRQRQVELLQKQLQKDRIRKRRHSNLQHWGFEPAYSSVQKPPIFPSTFDEVAEDAYHAIRGTLLGLQRPDPNRVVNAMHRSVLDYRPTQPYYASSQNLDEEYTSYESGGNSKMTPPIARMGIEIDGAAHLLSSKNMQTDRRTTDEGRALRILSLKIAGRLASFHHDEQGTQSSVAVYYNSFEQTLLASSELQRLKQSSNDSFSAALDRINILCIGRDGLPKHMLRRKNSKVALTGIILVVKPTDYNFDSPVAIENSFDSTKTKYYPTIHHDIIEKLQSLLIQATASSIPAVVLSPRLSELPPLQQYSANYHHRTSPSGFEQSGFQQSATFGGMEPPVGPTSWLLRDLIPPVYVWVGNSLDLLGGPAAAGQKRRSRPSLESLIERYGAEIEDDNVCHFYSGVALVQSSMDAGHMYHLFAVKETAEIGSYSGMKETLVWSSSSEFMGSMPAVLGRPTREAMKNAFEEWIENCE